LVACTAVSIGVARHHHDDRLGARDADLGKTSSPLAGHHHVEQDEIDVVLGDLRESDPAVAGDDHLIALDLERAADGRQDIRLVIDDQNRAARHWPQTYQMPRDPAMRCGHAELTNVPKAFRFLA
jgi:hypothetical protein